MTKVDIEYLQANGRVRRATAHTESQWPNFLINHSDKQAHSLVDSPVFPIDRKPVVFETWEEFIEAPPPRPKHFPDKLGAVIEDQSIWPISGDIVPDTQDRQMLFKEFAEEAEQLAVASATRAAAGSSLVNAWSIASLMIFCLMASLILLIVLQSNLAQGLLPSGNPPVPAAAALLVLPGLVLPWRRKKAVRASEDIAIVEDAETDTPEPPKRRRRKKLKELETLRVWDETTNSTWSASLPFNEILGRVPVECRYTQELSTARQLAMGLFGGLVLLMGIMVTTVMGWSMIWGGVASVLLALFGVLYGYLKGFESFMTPPIWVVRRMYERMPIDPEDESKGYTFNYDAFPVIVPEFHTKLTGMSMDLAVTERRNAAEEGLRGTSQGQNHSNNGEVSTLTKRNLAVAFSPRIWRASMLYEMLKGRDIKSRMKGPGNKGDKLQKISMAGMALGSVGLLIAAMVFLQ